MLSRAGIHCIPCPNMSRIFAISDLHVDVSVNQGWVEGLSSSQFKNDVIVVAGDVTDNMDLLRKTLQNLKQKFLEVCYVPGNHELWLRSKRDSSNPYKDSIDKFNGILALCNSLGIHVKPLKVYCTSNNPAWVVPLFSWYTQPEEDLEDTLFVSRESESPELTQNAWMDNHFCVWPENLRGRIAKYFGDLNDESLSRHYDATVISFSHFIPRFDLIPASDNDLQAVQNERTALGLSELENPNAQGANIKFNFSRYAGCKQIEAQIRRLNSRIHIFGHQHRNRDRIIDDIRYVSFCLGYPRERAQGLMWGLRECSGPKQVWP